MHKKIMKLKYKTVNNINSRHQRSCNQNILFLFKKKLFRNWKIGKLLIIKRNKSKICYAEKKVFADKCFAFCKQNYI